MRRTELVQLRVNCKTCRNTINLIRLKHCVYRRKVWSLCHIMWTADNESKRVDCKQGVCLWFTERRRDWRLPLTRAPVNALLSAWSNHRSKSLPRNTINTVCLCCSVFSPKPFETFHLTFYSGSSDRLRPSAASCCLVFWCCSWCVSPQAWLPRSSRLLWIHQMTGLFCLKHRQTGAQMKTVQGSFSQKTLLREVKNQQRPKVQPRSLRTIHTGDSTPSETAFSRWMDTLTLYWSWWEVGMVCVSTAVDTVGEIQLWSFSEAFGTLFTAHLWPWTTKTSLKGKFFEIENCYIIWKLDK